MVRSSEMNANAKAQLRTVASWVNKKHTLVGLAIIIFAFGAAAALRLHQFSPYKNVINLDASYHMILTVEALQQHSIRQDLLLPIVTLGSPDNRGVPWGAAIPNARGNYFYTSFPPMGFIVPYVALSATHLEPSLKNLMLFNLSLNLLTALTLFFLLREIMSKFKSSQEYRSIVAAILSAAYIFSYETLYSQGVIYWAQSLFQLIWITQILAVLQVTKSPTKKFLALLFILSGLATATEWTGYIVAVATIIFLLVFARKSKNYTPAIVAGTGSLAGVLLFILPALIGLGYHGFLKALSQRYGARSLDLPGTGYLDLLWGYWDSFGPYLALLAGMVILALADRKMGRRAIQQLPVLKWILFLATIPLLENLIMKQHAVLYSFDRLKLFLPIALLFLIFFKALGGKGRIILASSIVLCAGISVEQFLGGSRETAIPDLAYNSSFLQHLNIGAPKTTYATNGPVRGYIVSELGHNPYEEIRTEAGLDVVAGLKGSDRAVWLIGRDGGSQNYIWDNAVIRNYRSNTTDVYGVLSKNDILRNELEVDPSIIGYVQQLPSPILKINNVLIPIKIDSKTTLKFLYPARLNDAEFYTYKLISVPDK